MRKNFARLFVRGFALLLLVGIASVSLGISAHTPVHASASTRSGDTPCTSMTWLTQGLADDDENGFHLHVQLQGLMDQSDTSHYCGRAIGNAYLDEPTGAVGELRVFADDGTAVLRGGIFDHQYENEICNLPTQCTFLSSDSGRGLAKFELGGPGYSFALASTHNGYSSTVRVCAEFTQSASDGTTKTITSQCTNIWRIMPNIPIPAAL